MNKDELKKQLEDFAKKSKASSLKVASEIRKKAQEFFADFKERRQRAKEAKTKRENLKIYEDKDKELKPSSSTFTIKPMSLSGQKVSTKKALFSKFKGITFAPGFCFSVFTIKVLFLGSAFVSAWFLGLSFNTTSKPYYAFLSLFLVGLTIRYIKKSQGSLCYGLLMGFFANIFIFDWIFDTVLFGTANYLLATGSLLGLSLLLALPYMLFTLFAWQYKHKLALYPFASACAWVALELVVQLISYKGFGFPWFVLGYSQYANLELIQISSLIGAYGVSFFIVFCSFSASLVLGKDIKFKDRFLNFLFILVIYFVFACYGKAQLEANKAPENSRILKAAIIQPNTHQDMISGNMQQVSNTLNDIANYLQSYTGLDLIIWPESTLPGYLEEGSLKDFMAKVSKETKASQIAGATALGNQVKNNKLSATQEESLKEFVGAGLYQQGNLVAQHHKRKLVPFGEFLPFQKQLKDFYEKNAISSLTGSFVEGSGPAQVLILPGEEKISFGTQICFESIFPILWRLEVIGGAEFFVNLSNDGWFLNTAAPYQHLRINVFRAVENNRPILRSANSGISAYINNFGKIEYHSNLNEQDIEIVELPLPLNQTQTFYTIYGDIFGFLCLFLTLVFSYNCLDITQEND
ncbi:MAG: apolipoprotein N-acyltransferase [Elusimicrobiaceae bacterium]|nr:apolipoprotein N-acyltransferase [Elusimicrobiaceae bacterium]